MEIINHFKKQHPEIQSVGDITWSHAVNSREKLARTLSSDLMIIESDIRVSRSGQIVAVHPPETESDLSLEELLQAVRQTDKGLKLDFKDPEILVASLDMVAKMNFEQPVILNADVLDGNGAPRSKFSPYAFVSLCRAVLPEAVLSVGWTSNTTDKYTAKNVAEMADLVATAGDSVVTFPVRACLIPASWEVLKGLLEINPKYSFSVWNNEPVTDEQLDFIRQNMDPVRTFFDFIDESKDPLRLI